MGFENNLHNRGTHHGYRLKGVSRLAVHVVGAHLSAFERMKHFLAHFFWGGAIYLSINLSIYLAIYLSIYIYNTYIIVYISIHIYIYTYYW